jgi:hypothetical protein
MIEISSMFLVVLLSLGVGIGSNGIAEALLAFEMRLPFRSLDRSQRRLRVLRWVICITGFGLLGFFNPSVVALIALASFSVTAATDFETRRIPPDWFTYGSVLVLCGLGFAVGGLSGFRDVVVAQALCFVAMVLAVVLARAASPGDIKVLMQYGASCGSLPVVMVGFIAETLLRLGLVACMVARALGVQEDRRGALARGLHMRLPHAPVAWFGVLAALMAHGAGWI